MAGKPRHRTWMSALYPLLIVAGLILFGAGGYQYYVADQAGEKTDAAAVLIAIGAVAVIVTAALFPIAWSMLNYADNGGQQDRLLTLLKSIDDRMMLSEIAKRVASRHHDREVIRRAIQEDLARNDLDSALALAKELGDVHGYQQESEEFRERILGARAAQYQQRINFAINQLDQFLADHDWEKASAEAAKIQRLFPESPRVADLTRRVKLAWEQHKIDLERKFLEAAKRDDIELAMDLLKQLDRYLSEAEAAPFVEVARGVIGKKKENLGVQFKLAVHDHDWMAAVQVGDQIIREFPNTRMSDEVRTMIDLLRERAAGQRAAIPRTV